MGDTIVFDFTKGQVVIVTNGGQTRPAKEVVLTGKASPPQKST